MATTAYLRVSTGSQGPPSSCKSRSQRRPSPRLSASASHHLPLYQEKAVTPTPLKDIFTSIWAGPFPPTHLANGLYFRRLYEKNDPGRRTGRFGTQARIALTSDIRHGWFPLRSKGSVGTGPSVASFSSQFSSPRSKNR